MTGLECLACAAAGAFAGLVTYHLTKLLWPDED